MLFSKQESLYLAESLPITISRNQTQQLKVAGAQPRPGNLSPNPVASQPSLTVPQHVQNVQAVLKRTSDMSTKVTVTFKRDPSDPLFIETRAYVSGYKGNPSPVQVGSGQSPISFALENTGEAITVSVQASGNLGQAPISTAPSTTFQLAKTGLATIATAAGNGPSDVVLGLTSPSWWNSGDGSSFAMGASTTGLWGTGTANQVKVWLVRIPYSITIRRITTRTVGPLAASKSSLACYDANGNKLFAYENFATNTSGVTLTTTITPVTLPAGLYYMACACDTTGAAPTTLGGFVANGTNEGVEPYNTQGVVRSGTAANAMSGGTMPSALGALSPGGGSWTTFPLWTMEP